MTVEIYYQTTFDLLLQQDLATEVVGVCVIDREQANILALQYSYHNLSIYGRSIYEYHYVQVLILISSGQYLVD